MGDSQKEENIKSNNGISRKRKLIFNTILIAFTISLFLLLEFGLRIFSYGNDLRLFEKSENYPGYYEINQDVNLRYFSKIINTSPTNDIFLVEKPDTCYRIFVFGGSTTRGFPYQASTAFPRILYYQLQDVFPDKRIEVINLSASALNSYAYIDMIDEVLKQHPDAILVYGGHNEYYGALGVGSVERGGSIKWTKKLHLKLGKLRTYQLVQNLVRRDGKKSSGDEDAVGRTLMDRIVKDKEILLDSPVFQSGVEQFDDNISILVKKASRKKIPVVLSELVSNVHDQQPFKSVAEGDLLAAMSVFQAAKELEENGESVEARQLYYEAKDLDPIRFRAPEAFNEVLHGISEEYSLPLVPMKQIFEAASPGQYIGNELILEHLHPSIDGQFLMADAFFNVLKENHFISTKWDAKRIKPISTYRNNWGFTALDSMIGDLNVKYLKEGWPFKLVDGPNRFLDTYRYTDYVDSMALAYISANEKHIEDEHIKLARYYSQIRRPDKAFEEYFSMIKLHPYVGDLYHDAIRYLIPQRKYAEALALMNSAPLMKHDYYYHYMQGTLQVKLYHMQQAIINLETALEMNKLELDPVKILQPLYVAYNAVGDRENEKRVLGLIREINPKFEEINIMQRRIHPDRDVTYGDVIAKSIQLIRDKDLDNAEILLMSLNRVEETFESCKLTSTVYILKKDFKLAYEYSLKAFQFYSTDIENNNNLFSLALAEKEFEVASEVLNELKMMNVGPERIQHLEELYEKRRNDVGE